MVEFIDDHRKTYGVEPICKVLPIAPSTYHRHRAEREKPESRCERKKRDEALRPQIQQVWDESFGGVYGVRKVWRQLQLDGVDAARCTVARLMREMGLSGARRGRAFKVTTVPDESAMRPADLVERKFEASRPNELWVADITYVATWTGFAYAAFERDALSRLRGDRAGTGWTLGGGGG